MTVHFIAIGGSIMHNLALALERSGDRVTGSDDEIYEPSRSRLAEAGLLPDRMGWDPGRISNELDAVILGMHARRDNPELRRALELEIPVYSFPEFVGMRSADKKRVVVAGSHGKTTTTSMIMHVLTRAGMDFDYLVGAQLPDFDLMVRLSNAPLIILEGDEYLSSALDRRPKFVHYNPHLTAVTGIAWDHMNVFPEYNGYVQLFRDYLQGLNPDSTAFLCESDETLIKLGSEPGVKANVDSYGALPYAYQDGAAQIRDSSGTSYEVGVYGRHNFENMRAALEICKSLGLPEEEFFRHIGSFKGAALRMQTIYEDQDVKVIRDFAHAPSKVRATLDAVRERYPDAHISAILELHTYSSLNRGFMPQYAGALSQADQRIVCYNPETLKIKKLEPVDDDFIARCFQDPVQVFTNASDIPGRLQAPKPTLHTEPSTLHLWMSSGRFGGLDIAGLYKGSQS